MAPESQNEMITLLADQVRQEIILDIKQAGMFSVSTDTKPDLSKSNQMTVVCRLIGTDGTPKERLLAMKHVTPKSGDDTAKDIIHSLNTDELYVEIEKSVEGVEHDLKLRNLSKTRWTARAESIRALWISYEEVKESLDTIASSKELNVIDAMIIVKCAVKRLSEIRANADEMEPQIQAGISFTEKLGQHPFAEFQRKHRVKRQPRRIDENP
eukprot:gene16397-7801_t